MFSQDQTKVIKDEAIREYQLLREKQKLELAQHLKKEVEKINDFEEEHQQKLEQRLQLKKALEDKQLRAQLIAAARLNMINRNNLNGKNRKFLDRLKENLSKQLERDYGRLNLNMLLQYQTKETGQTPTKRTRFSREAAVTNSKVRQALRNDEKIARKEKELKRQGIVVKSATKPILRSKLKTQIRGLNKDLKIEEPGLIDFDNLDHVDAQIALADLQNSVTAKINQNVLRRQDRNLKQIQGQMQVETERKKAEITRKINELKARN